MVEVHIAQRRRWFQLEEHDAGAEPKSEAPDAPKEGLAAGEPRSALLGTPTAPRPEARWEGRCAPQAIAASAHRRFEEIRRMVEDARSAECDSLSAIADELNAGGIATRRGGRWHKPAVTNLLKRLELPPRPH